MNRFPNTCEITRKDLLYKHIARMQSAYGMRYFNFVPKSFILPQDTAILNEEYLRNKKQMWIFKPCSSCQGKGIFLTSEIPDVKIKQNMIASHYITNPLLINGFKFDLRIYVIITSVNPLRIYRYK